MIAGTLSSVDRTVSRHRNPPRLARMAGSGARYLPDRWAGPLSTFKSLGGGDPGSTPTGFSREGIAATIAHLQPPHALARAIIEECHAAPPWIESVEGHFKLLKTIRFRYNRRVEPP